MVMRTVTFDGDEDGDRCILIPRSLANLGDGFQRWMRQADRVTIDRCQELYLSQYLSQWTLLLITAIKLRAEKVHAMFITM